MKAEKEGLLLLLAGLHVPTPAAFGQDGAPVPSSFWASSLCELRCWEAILRVRQSQFQVFVSQGRSADGLEGPLLSGMPTPNKKYFALLTAKLLGSQCQFC